MRGGHAGHAAQTGQGLGHQAGARRGQRGRAGVAGVRVRQSVPRGAWCRAGLAMPRVTCAHSLFCLPARSLLAPWPGHAGQTRHAATVTREQAASTPSMQPSSTATPSTVSCCTTCTNTGIYERFLLNERQMLWVVL